MAFIRPLTRLFSGPATVSGTSRRESTGTGVAAASDATVAGAGAVGVYGSGVLQATTATVTGDGGRAPVFTSTPNPVFNEGVSRSYDLKLNVDDDYYPGITWTLSNEAGLGPGVSFDSANAILSYSGVGAPSSSQHTLTATDNVGSDTSATFTVQTQATTGVTIGTIPDLTLQVAETHDMDQYITDPQGEVVSTDILGLNTSIGSYDDNTRLLTGDAPGTMNGLQLEVRTGHVYTATHYVAPFADVSGASSDEDPQDATAYSNATSASTPCTLMCAVMNATAGNNVQMAPGIYDSSATSPPADTWTPIFGVQNNGTASEPIVFFAQYPAAYHSDQPSRLTEFRQVYGPYVENSATYSPPIFFGLQGSYQILDGVFIDESVSVPRDDKGFISMTQLSNNCEVRRVWIDRTDCYPYETGRNRGTIWSSDSIGCRVTDCLGTGNGSMSNRNSAFIQCYRAQDFTVENNTLSGAPGIYIKAEVIPSPPYLLQNVHVRNNLVTDPYSYSLRTSAARSIYIYGNVFEGQYEGKCMDIGGAAADTYPVPVWVYNNTLVITGSGAIPRYQLGIQMDAARDNNNQTEIYNNIFVDATTNVGTMLNIMEAIGAEHDDIDGMARLNNNVYYSVNFASPTNARDIDHPTNSYTLYTPLSSWQTFASGFGTSPVYGGEVYEAASVDSDPVFETPNYSDVAAGDWRLQAGSQDARTIGATSSLITDYATTVCGAYVTGNEEVGQRSKPTY